MTQTHPFSSILIANRGEIACRIIRTAKSMGLRTIAVYSEADHSAPHVTLADEAVLLGPAPVGESYLAMDRVMDAVAQTQAEAVHPGYGFLSENADFARACDKAGVIFIGPNIDAIDIMGDKAKSKRRMIEAGVPCIPGYQGEDQSDETLIGQSASIGFPLMVKAAAGGGGRGMRLVHEADELASAIKLARSEAENAFGSGELILEKAIIEPRHVEIQVFADKNGTVIHLGERDCSVQRRHQKVLEEAPCPVMTPDLRARMGAAAVQAAKDVDYIGAGTVEFLLDSSGEFYFLEMNTRLQVEHPVTETITGLDLVELQIRVAKGEPLGLVQDDITLTGHAIEARLYAEDPSQDFLPATGPVDLWRPALDSGIRIDAGIDTGGEISPFYDPMIAKVIGFGQTREEARLTLIKALTTTALFGVTTNKGFLIEALEKPDFIQGGATTAFIADNFSAQTLTPKPLDAPIASMAAVLLFYHARQHALAQSVGMPEALLGWTSATPIETPYRFLDAQTPIDIGVTPVNKSTFKVTSEEDTHILSIISIEDNSCAIETDNDRQMVLFNIPVNDPSGQTIQLSVQGTDYHLVNDYGVIASASEGVGEGAIIAPMHGMVLDIAVKEGDPVKKGDRLGVLEAMKMQHELCADVDGIVEAVHFDAGVQVPADALLMQISVTSEEA